MSNELSRDGLYHPTTSSQALFFDLGQVQSGAALLEEVVILYGTLGHSLGIARGPLQVLLSVVGLLGTPLGLESILLMLCCLIIVCGVI